LALFQRVRLNASIFCSLPLRLAGGLGAQASTMLLRRSARFAKVAPSSKIGTAMGDDPDDDVSDFPLAQLLTLLQAKLDPGDYDDALALLRRIHMPDELDKYLPDADGSHAVAQDASQRAARRAAHHSVRLRFPEAASLKIR
jgi:hypothetical protein